MEHQKVALPIDFAVFIRVLYGFSGSVSTILFVIHCLDKKFKNVSSGLPRHLSRSITIFHRHRNQQRKGQLRKQDYAMPWIQGI